MPPFGAAGLVYVEVGEVGAVLQVAVHGDAVALVGTLGRAGSRGEQGDGEGDGEGDGGVDAHGTSRGLGKQPHTVPGGAGER